LEERAEPDPLLLLIAMPVRPEAELQASTHRILGLRPDLLSTVLTNLFERFPMLTLTCLEGMVIAGIPTAQLLHTRAAQVLWDRGQKEGLDMGREEGESQGEFKVPLRQLNRRCGPLSDARTASSRPCRWSCWRPG
jgi:hypothetical protein